MDGHANIAEVNMLRNDIYSAFEKENNLDGIGICSLCGNDVETENYVCANCEVRDE